jgi:hypothetical protein
MSNTGTYEALDGIKQMLMADGYDLLIDDSQSDLQISVAAGPEACEDCLVPKDVMISIIQASIPDVQKPIVLTYPNES